MSTHLLVQSCKDHLGVMLVPPEGPRLQLAACHLSRGALGECPAQRSQIPTAWCVTVEHGEAGVGH